VPLQPRDSWFNPAGIIDLAIGRITRLPSDNRSDHAGSVWMKDNRILTMKLGIRAGIWQFTPERVAK